MESEFPEKSAFRDCKYLYNLLVTGIMYNSHVLNRVSTFSFITNEFKEIGE